jgi:hypothetical protein
MGITLIPGLTRTESIKVQTAANAANAATAAAAAAAVPNNSPADALAQSGYPSDFGDAVEMYPGAPAGVSSQDIETVTLNPLKLFTGDIPVPGAGALTVIDVWGQMGPNCVGFNLLLLTEPAFVNINGGGFRTVPSDMVLDGSIIKTLAIINPGANSVCQLNGV